MKILIHELNSRAFLDILKPLRTQIEEDYPSRVLKVMLKDRIFLKVRTVIEVDVGWIME